MKQPEVVATSDFTLAAVALVRGFRLLGTEPDPAGPFPRKQFVLHGDSAAFVALSRRLLLGDVPVPARAFALAQRRLKRLLYAESGGPTGHAEARV